MANPISIASLVAAALHTSKVVYELIQRAKDAPQEVREILVDSLVIRNSLSQLKKNFDDGEEIVSNIEEGLRAPLSNTQTTLGDLAETLGPFIRAKTSRWKTIEWAWRRKEINDLKEKLNRSQAALAMALAVTLKCESKIISTDTNKILDTQTLTLANLTGLGDKLEDHTHSIKDTQTAILETVRRLEARGAGVRREDVWHNPTDLVGLSQYLESVAVTRCSPPPTNAAGMSTFDEDFDDDTPPPELKDCKPPAWIKEDSEAEIDKLLLQSSDRYLMNDEGQTALHLAVQQDAYLTQKVLRHGFYVDEPNIEGETPLMSAILVENIDTAKILLKQGADVNATSDSRKTPLHFAAKYNKEMDITQLLLRRKADVGTVDNSRQTPLFTAALYGNGTICRQLLEHEAIVQAHEADGWTALHYLAMRGNSACMDRLLSSAGADVEIYYSPDHFGLQSSVVYDTSLKRKVGLVELFVEKGVDINAKRKSCTALNIAVLTCQDLLVTVLLSHNATAHGSSLVCLNWGLSLENLALLLQRGADIEARDSRHSKTALIWASETGPPAAVKILLDHGANVDTQDSQGISALRYAAANARTETVKMLLEKGADPSLSDGIGKTPLIAVAWGRPFTLGHRSYSPSPVDRENTASLLLDAGADASALDNWGGAAIHYAVQNGYLGLIKVLYKKGKCDLSLEWEGKAPLQFAVESDDGPVVKWLKRQLSLSGKNFNRGDSSRDSGKNREEPSDPIV